jgi:hypothetical protein
MIRNPCPKCGFELEQGYGLAGGGMGPYEFCPKDGCDYFTKSQDPEMEQVAAPRGNTMNIPVKTDIMESVIVKGDLAKLTPDERVRYYGQVCNSLGLNPLTKPFEFITLNNRLVLYALRTATDQLRKINNVTLEIVSREIANDILTVHVRARLPDGRADEDLGSVYYPETLKGEARANAELKAVTKGKRRVTLSICGLGWLDELEIDDVPVMAHRRPPPPAPNAMLQHDPETGEVSPPAPVPREAAEQAVPSDTETDSGGAAMSLEEMAREAALRGEAVFKKFYKSRTPDERTQLNEMGDELRGLMT